MDHRTWTDPMHCRSVNLLLLIVCLCLIRQHAAYPSLVSDTQGASEDSRNQLDSLSSPDQDDPDYKRSSAFFPLRGKKLTLDPELMSEDTEEDKRSHFYPLRGKKASYFMPMRGRKDDENWPEDLEKRMSSFMPMRGKKSILQRLGNPGTYAPHNILYPSSSASMSFLPEDNATANHPLQKRSVAFMPMRGRREDIATTLLEKKMSSFMPMRGRRFPYGDVTEDGQSSNRSDSEEELAKRASSFMPMRGRKSSFLDDYDLEDEEDKRGRPSFNAMRGRRADLVLEGRDQRASSFMASRGRREELLEDKRMGFVPMRGRREEEEEKRSQFMPMRGRRNATQEEDELMDARERRRASGYVFSPVLVSSGIGSSLMSRHWGGLFPVGSVRSAASRTRKVDWDSVKRGFHATRGKRMDGETEVGCRCKRSLLRPHKQYIALKRPMSFFATRGKRMDSSVVEPKLR